MWQWVVVFSHTRAEHLTQTLGGDRKRAPPCPLVPLFPARAFSHRVVWFFQVVRGSAAKFIQSAKLCSTPCRPPEGSSPTDKRWEPELNAWPGHNRLSLSLCPSATASGSSANPPRSFDRALARTHTRVALCPVSRTQLGWVSAFNPLGGAPSLSRKACIHLRPRKAVGFVSGGPRRTDRRTDGRTDSS